MSRKVIYVTLGLLAAGGVGVAIYFVVKKMRGASTGGGTTTSLFDAGRAGSAGSTLLAGAARDFLAGGDGAGRLRDGGGVSRDVGRQ